MPFDEAINPYVQKVRNHSHIGQSHIIGEATIFADAPEKSYRILDLGCGNGHFLEERLKSDSNTWGVGIEKRFKRAFKTAEKIETTSSKVLQMDFIEFLQSSPLEFWDEVWLQFPDPWPKLRHEKNRSVNAGNLQLFFSVLKKGGRFCFRSDSENYFLKFLDLHERLRIFPIMSSKKGDLFEDLPKTLFQRKFLVLGIPIYSVEMRK